MTELVLFISGLFVLPIASLVFAALAPRLWQSAARSYAAAGFSPIWFVIAPLTVIALVELRPVLDWHYRYNYYSEPFVFTVVLAEAIAGMWVIYRHRKWPWAAVSVVVFGLISSVFLFVGDWLSGIRPH